VKRLLISAVLPLIALVLAAAPCRADLMFQLGNNPQPDEENVLLNTGTTASTVFGNTQTSNISVRFSSTTNTLTEPASGQARVGATNDAILNLTIDIPGGYYLDLILNPFLDRQLPGAATVTVVTDQQTVAFDYPDPGLDNGSNFLTIIASAGEHILSTTIDSETGFGDLRQPRISGAALNNPDNGGGDNGGGNPPPTAAPEPASLLLLVSGLGAAGMAGLRRVRRQENGAEMVA
jgi:hypothetical protein